MSKKPQWNNDESSSHEEVGKKHADYERNLIQAKGVIERVTPILPQGMRVVVEGDPKHRLLWISYDPPENSKMGRFAAPINLHQPKDEFIKEAGQLYNAYLKMAQKENKNCGLIGDSLV